MPEQDPRQAFGLALKSALEGPIMRSAGTTALTVALFKILVDKGALDKRKLVEILDQFVQSCSTEQRRDFTTPFEALGNLLDPTRFPKKRQDDEFPDWEEMIKKLPPLPE